MARLTHLEDRGGRWYFLFRAEASEETFEAALQTFKRVIPAETRQWHEDLSRWSVDASEANRIRLGYLYPNFPEALRLLHSQLTLF